MSRPPRRGYAPPPPGGYPASSYYPPGGGYMPGHPSYGGAPYYHGGPPGPYGAGPRYGPPNTDTGYYDPAYSSSEEKPAARRAPPAGYGYSPSSAPDPSPSRASGGGFESGSNSDTGRNPATGRGGKSPYANDCEIVVLSKAQQQYGEMVERLMRDAGLNVDIMFPKGEIKIQEFLKPVAKLGTIFAIIIDNENEKNKSVHFYQFRGVPKAQLCKNVPLQVAKDMILKKYKELMQKEIGTVPENMKILLHKLLKEQNLEDTEYSGLLRFIQERRGRQNSFLNRTSNVVSENKDNISSLVDTPEGKELTNRILSIMNENQDAGKATVVPPSKP